MARMTAQQRRVNAALAKLEPRIRAAFVEAIQMQAGAIDQKALIDALESRDIERAVQILRLDEGMMWPLDEAIRSAYIRGGAMVLADLPKGLSGRFGFNGRHIRAEAWVRDHVGSLIQGIATGSEAMTREVIRDGLVDGTSSRTLARQITGNRVGTQRIGGYLGLTTQQTASIDRGRRLLMSGDPAEMAKYRKLKMRDKRFDAQIKKAAKAGKPITGAQLDRILDAHKSKALGYRGRLIAKNESHTALAAGRHESYQQLLDNPEVEAVTVRWQHGLSQEPRLEHVAMDGTVIDFGETFDFTDAQMQHPHDPAGGAGHSANCRCVAIYRIRRRRDV